MNLFLILLPLAAASTPLPPGAPPPPPLSPPTCDETMYGPEGVGGPLNMAFPEAVAHRLHSLTLEDIQYYFHPNATADNRIPTVNLDLTPGAERVLYHAPLNGYDTTFDTIAMRHIDEVLKRMDDPSYAITNYNILEKVVHAMHMAELWTDAAKHYRELFSNPPSVPLCACVTDSARNGLLDELQLLALKIKFPGVTSGLPNLPYGRHPPPAPARAIGPAGKGKYELSYKIKTGGSVRQGPQAISPAVMRPRRSKLAAFDWTGEEVDVVDRAMTQLQDGDGGLDIGLVSEEGWQSWRQGFHDMPEFDNYQFAMFMYCMLEQ